MISISRCVTIYGQWDYVPLWLDNLPLFSPDIEWILVNDHPGDLCPQPLRSTLEARGVLLVENEFNLGRSGARNRALALARGEWVEFVDGDDIPLPLELPAPALLATAGLLQFSNAFYRLDGALMIRLGEDAEVDNVWQRLGLLTHLPPVNCRPACLVFRTELIRRVGGFDGRFDTCEDLHLVWKLDQLAPVVLSLPVAKQLYRRDEQASCDSDSISWGMRRLMKVASRASGRRNLEIESARLAYATCSGLLGECLPLAVCGTEPNDFDPTGLLDQVRRLWLARWHGSSRRRLKQALKFLARWSR
jgi:hypothetical protein